MDRQAQLKEWRKYRRQSLMAIPVEAILLVVAVLTLWALGNWFEIPFWISVIIVAASAWGLVGDTFNVLYLNRRIALAAQEGADPER